jgi:putative Mg2+ transporter-C (MgtC) family protein
MEGFAAVPMILARLVVAIVLGGILGVEREVHGRWAGFRTHMMVSIGAAVFVLLGLEIAAGDPAQMTRVIQGIATGIGFLGAGTILKLSDKVEVKGLTTASSIWLAAAVGTAAGLGRYLVAILATVVSLVVLALLRPVGKQIDGR